MCQAVTLTLAPTLLGISVEDCACTHGPDAACPMHHGRIATDSTVCVMQSATADVPTTLSVLFSALGLVPSTPTAINPSPITQAVPPDSQAFRQRSSTPDSPPPRT
jgi:hypothetical protein